MSLFGKYGQNIVYIPLVKNRITLSTLWNYPPSITFSTLWYYPFSITLSTLWYYPPSITLSTLWYYPSTSEQLLVRKNFRAKIMGRICQSISLNNSALIIINNANRKNYRSFPIEKRSCNILYGIKVKSEDMFLLHSIFDMTTQT